MSNQSHIDYIEKFHCCGFETEITTYTRVEYVRCLFNQKVTDPCGNITLQSGGSNFCVTDEEMIETCPYFSNDSWSTESPNRNVPTLGDGTVSRRPRIHHRDHWRAYSTCRIRYDCLKIAEHELRRYHGVSRCSYGCTVRLTVGLRLGLCVVHLKGGEHVP